MLTAERLWLEAEVAIQTIAAVKERPAWETALEERVLAAMQAEFDAATAQVIAALSGMDRLPAGDVALVPLLQPLYDLIDPLAEALLAGAIEAADQGEAVAVAAAANKQFSESAADVLRERTFEASQRTMERVIGLVMEGLASSVDDNLGVRDAAQRLDGVFLDMRDWELRRVARTEIIGAENAATFSSLSEYGIDFQQWWSARDSRVRDSHADLHGEIVAVGDTFSNGLKHPGDRSGPIEEWINCRCRPLPFLMPEGMKPPPGKDRFFESDLVPVDAAIADERTTPTGRKLPAPGANPYGAETTGDYAVLKAERMDVAFAGWGENLPADSARALRDYQSEMYQPINTSLRQGEDLSAFPGTINALREAFNADARLPADMKIYRRTSLPESIKPEVDGTITDPAYQSTSLDPKYPSDVSYQPDEAVLEILADAGTPGVWMNANPNSRADYEYEQEVLLPEGTSYEVVEVLQEAEPASEANGWRGKAFRLRVRYIPPATLKGPV